MNKNVMVLLLLLIAAISAILLFQKRGRPQATANTTFEEVMQAGKNYYDKGDAEKAIEAFQKGVQVEPNHFEARLNLANALLLKGDAEQAVAQAQKAIDLNHNSAAAHYVLGCAYLRLAKPENAVKSLQISRDLDRAVAATSFQLGRAHLELSQLEEAISALQEAIALEGEHPAAHYALSQALVRNGKQTEAQTELEIHRQILAKGGNTQPNAATYERSKHTMARIPFKPEYPLENGIAVTYSDKSNLLGTNAKSLKPPLALLDLEHSGELSLWAGGENGFQLLSKTNGQYEVRKSLPMLPGNTYKTVLVADLQNDRAEDLIAIGDKGISVFKFNTNGGVSEVTAFSGLKNLGAVSGALVDFDFTGKLDLVLATATNNSVEVFRNIGNFLFRNNSATSGIPTDLQITGNLKAEDWNGDDMPDLIIGRTDQPPLLLTKIRGGGLTATNQPSWPMGQLFTIGDINNDLNNDLAIITTNGLEIVFTGQTNNLKISSGNLSEARGIELNDYDNDGWLDIFVYGQGVRVWRNTGPNRFVETTAKLGLDRLLTGSIQEITWADLDLDGDTDLLVAPSTGGVKLLSNEGGNAHHQLKIQLMGNRSNASGLGVRVEVAARGLKLTRTLNKLPLEIGLGRHKQADSVTVRWFDLVGDQVDVVAEKQPVPIMELILPTGSCPYLYAWDGSKFRFVTDLLGAAPLGLRISDNRFIEADPEEYVWIGNEQTFPPRGGKYVLQITEELREVLYLDEARLAVVDHEPEILPFPSNKLRPGKPFPPAQLVAATKLSHPIKAIRSDGKDVTDQLKRTDQQYVSPIKLREPQLRGLAEPFFVELEFQEQNGTNPLLLVLNGWLRFGGGMANVSASHRPELPFPFPTLEVKKDGQWKKIEVDFGAPAGKTKTIIVNLGGAMPARFSQLRITTAFEIHWDEIALAEGVPAEKLRISEVYPQIADLHWRGFSAFADLPWTHPLTPLYNEVLAKPPWRITPAGWCTRYGPVEELIKAKDNALALLNGGDELTVEFDASKLPPVPPGQVRDFFFFSVGWDKDADFHVEKGYMVEPLPFHGMNDQLYGKEKNPNPGDWEKQFNTRWVGPLTLRRN